MKSELSDYQIFQERFNAVGMFCIAIFYGYIAYIFLKEGYANWWYELVIPDSIRNSYHARIIIANGLALKLFMLLLILYFSVTGNNYFDRHYRAPNDLFAYLFGTVRYLFLINCWLILPIHCIGFLTVEKGISGWFSLPATLVFIAFLVAACHFVSEPLARILRVKIVNNQNQEK